MYPITERLIPVNRYSRPGVALVGVKGLVIHWTGNTSPGADADHNNRYFANLADQSGDSGTYASAHYNVDDHSIFRNLPEGEMAYHVGAPKYNPDTLNLLDTTYPNNCTIGIEWCVNSDNDFNETYKRVVWLAADICRRHGLSPLTHMIRHYDVTWKDCPHFFTPNVANGDAGWARFRKDVQACLDAGQFTETPFHALGKTTDNLNVRVSPSPDAAMVTEIPNETVINLTAKVTLDNGKLWYKTTYGEGGYVSAAYVITPPPVVHHLFEDVDKHWAKASVDHLVSLGLLAVKNPDGSPILAFRPDVPLTRAEMVALLSRTLKLLGK